MATNLFIKFEDPKGTHVVKGECTEKKHTDWIEVMSWSHGFSQPTSPTRSSAGSGTVEKANHSDLSFTKYVDSATDDILKLTFNGNQVALVTLECYRADDAPIAYLKVEMEGVIISSVSVSGGGGDLPVENISLAYSKVTYTYTGQKTADGSIGDPVVVYHDLALNEVG